MNNEVDFSLTAEDRCDRCNAQAFYLASLDGLPFTILFCRHCYFKHSSKLRLEGWDIIEDLAGIRVMTRDENYQSALV